MSSVEYLPATVQTPQELVLLHGWGCTREIWRPLLMHVRRWSNVTLLDVPGCAPGAEPVDHLDACLEYVLAHAPQRACFVGWSLGGQLAIELAQRDPDRVLAAATICSNPRFTVVDDWPGMDSQQFQAFTEKFLRDPAFGIKRFHSLQVGGSSAPRSLLRALREQSVELLRDAERSPECQPQLMASNTARLKAVPVAFEQEVVKRHATSTQLLLGLQWLQCLDQRAVLKTLQQPQLHLLAERDALVPNTVVDELRQITSALSSVRRLDSVSHVAPLENPARIDNELHLFLNQHHLLQAPVHCAIEVEKANVADSFSRAAQHYEKVAHLQRDVGNQLLDQLPANPAYPQAVLDLGCGTGMFRSKLQERFPAARFIGLDIAPGMVAYAQQQKSDDSAWLIADAEALPLAAESVDLIFSSLAMQWSQQPWLLIAEIARVLRPGGSCVFSTLGPDTLHELRRAWQAVDSHRHVNAFCAASDLTAIAQDTADIELHLQTSEHRLYYEQVRDLLAELKTLGAHNMNRSRPAGLTGRHRLHAMFDAYEQWRDNGMLPATYEVIYGRMVKT